MYTRRRYDGLLTMLDGASGAKTRETSYGSSTRFYQIATSPLAGAHAHAHAHHGHGHGHAQQHVVGNWMPEVAG